MEYVISLMEVINHDPTGLNPDYLPIESFMGKDLSNLTKHCIDLMLEEMAKTENGIFDCVISLGK